MIKFTDFEVVLEIWKNHLWPNRKSLIESNSAMNFLSGYSMYNMQTKPSFIAYVIDDQICGINSGHLCSDNSYRSRGLYVFPEYRGHKIGTALLCATIDQGRKEGAAYVWSYPRKTSWNSYAAAGFQLHSDWETSETSDRNAYCKIIL